jgi:hypothetical protein
LKYLIDILSITFLPVSKNSWTLYSIAIFISGSHGCDLPLDLWSLDCQISIVSGVLRALLQMDFKALFGRAPAPAPPPAPAGALPNAKNDSSSGGGAPVFSLTGAVWARRSHKSMASSGSASPFPASPPGGACWSMAKDVGARGRSEKREARRRQASEGRVRSARQGRAAAAGCRGGACG